MNHSRTFVVILGCCLAGLGGMHRARGGEPEPIAADACMLDMLLPPDALVTIDGRDYGKQHRLAYSGLEPGKRVATHVQIRYGNGPTEDCRVWLDPGRTVRLARQRPAVQRPELALQTGHSNYVDYGAFSSDGRFLLTGSWDGTAALWEVASGRQLRNYAGHTNSINGVAMSPDGTTVFTGSLDGSVIIWDRDSGRKLKTLPMETCFSIALSPDRLKLLVGHFDHTASLWDVTNGKKLQSFTGGHTDSVFGVAFSPDSRQVLTGSWDRSAILWDAASGRLLRKFDGHAEKVNAVAFSPDGRRILVACGETNSETKANTGELTIWDARTGSQIARVVEPRHINTAAFSPNGAEVAASSRSTASGKQVSDQVLYDAEKLRPVRTLHDDRSSGACVFSSDGRNLFDGGVLWDKDIGQPVRCFDSRGESVRSATFCADCRRMLVRWNEGAVLLDAETGGMVHDFKSPLTADDPTSFVVGPDNQSVFALARSRETGSTSLLVFDAQRGTLLRHFPVSSGLASDLGVSADGTRALICSNRRASLWDIATGQQLQVIGGVGNLIYHCAISPDGSRVVTNSTSGLQNVAAVWDADSGAWLRTLGIQSQRASYSTGSCAFSTDGRRIIIGGGTLFGNPPTSSGFVTFWDAATGEMLTTLRGHTKRVTYASMTADGRYTVSSSDQDSTTIVWDLSSKQNLGVFSGVVKDCSHPLTPDGRLLTVCLDGSLRIWDVATGDELVRLISIKGGQDWLAVTPDGLFEGTEGGRKQVAFRVGGGLNIVPVDRFFQDFYRPGLLAEIARGERPMPAGEFASKVAPLVKILSPGQGSTMEASKLTLEVEVTDRGGGIKGPWLMQNGSRVLAEGSKRREGNVLHQALTFSLVEGENRVEVWAASSDGSWESEPAALVLKHEKPMAKPSVHLVAIGINKYAQETMNLKFAAPDAQAMADLFKTRGPALYGADQVDVVQLLDTQATTEAIRAAISGVAKRANPQDTMIVFLAGHGTTLGQRYYFIPQEFKHKAERLEEDIRQQGLSHDVLGDMLAQVPALKRVLIFDTCQSGGALPLATGARDAFAFRGALERLSRTQGIFSIAATAATDQAQEAAQLKHGVLTYALLAGMGAVSDGPLVGQAMRPSGDAHVAEVREWFNYAQDKVPLLTKLYFGQEQFVGFSGQGASFPVLPVGKPDQKDH